MLAPSKVIHPVRCLQLANRRTALATVADSISRVGRPVKAVESHLVPVFPEAS
jgi:hypothetical protein